MTCKHFCTQIWYTPIPCYCFIMRDRNSIEEKNLRKILKIRRLELNLTQRDLGKLLNTPHTFVNKYEVGERYLTFTEVIDICKNLKIDIHNLLDDVMKPPSNE
ncbi:helix-turn-helix domain-containing protein [Akkermansia muciniphila]|uniref:helix-turn-helix domain-containing protein n=2 Tax=Akkermansia muciniphila TaxID=239935 RepID=UPI0027D21222|nr:helix-turn-helix transcriptional regulator [Akkermansia muciniphila]